MIRFLIYKTTKMKKTTVITALLAFYALYVVAYVPSTYRTRTNVLKRYLRKSFNKQISPGGAHCYVVLGIGCPGCIRSTCTFIESMHDDRFYTVITRRHAHIPKTGAEVLIDSQGLCDRLKLLNGGVVSVFMTRYGTVDSVLYLDINNLESLGRIHP